MAKACQQLTHEERIQIYIMKQLGFSVREIADRLGRHRSTIYREIRRNSGGGATGTSRRMAGRWSGGVPLRRFRGR